MRSRRRGWPVVRLGAAAGRPVVQAGKNSLDGSLPTILQIVQIASSVASAVLPVVASYVASRKVKKIKLDGIEIDNPSDEQLERLWADYLARVKKLDDKT
jgi:hypothetical protein